MATTGEPRFAAASRNGTTESPAADRIFTPGDAPRKVRPALSANVPATVLASARVTGRRFRATVVLLVGWLLPAAASAALVFHELDHAHHGVPPRAVEAVVHGHLHSDSEPPHAHDLLASPEALRARHEARPIASPGAKAVAFTAPAFPPVRSLPRQDDPDPGGPSRQASLRVFRI